MISYKTPGSRRGKLPKMPKNIELLYKEGKCNECSVTVTRMDFAKILGKFTKVKIQYESSSTPKTKKNVQQKVTPNSNSRLKSNENGMVHIHRNAYNQVAELVNKKTKVNEKHTPHILSTNVKPKNKELETTQSNILKENNRVKKTPLAVGHSDNYIKNVINSTLKKYGIMFVDPSKSNNNYDCKSKLSLSELLPSIDSTILPSEDWFIDYLPKDGEPKEDKVYDRIAAELEDLMYSEKPADKLEEKTDNKDDFPSIMDILNENPAENSQLPMQSTTIIQPSLESSDVEAMLLGKPSENYIKEDEPSPMEVDNNNVLGNLIDVVPMSTPQDANNPQSTVPGFDNPHSPSILDETLQQGIEEHLPKEISPQLSLAIEMPPESDVIKSEVKKNETEKNDTVKVNFASVTHVVFKKRINGDCLKSVTCPKNLKYSAELEGKSVEFLGAPKFISSLEDLKVLLQIVDETNLSSLYILH